VPSARTSAPTAVSFAGSGMAASSASVALTFQVAANPVVRLYAGPSGSGTGRCGLAGEAANSALTAPTRSRLTSLADGGGGLAPLAPGAALHKPAPCAQR